MEVIRTAHSVYRLQYHVVWVCKYRRRILNPGVCGYLRKLVPKLLRSMPGVTVETIGFDRDHVHLVMGIPASFAKARTSSLDMGSMHSPSVAPRGVIFFPT